MGTFKNCQMINEPKYTEQKCQNVNRFNITPDEDVRLVKAKYNVSNTQMGVSIIS